jgi:hypothetical protein
MDKRIELSRNSLLLGNASVEVGEYLYARIGNYLPSEIEERRIGVINGQLRKDNLFVTEETSREAEEITRKYWEKRRELESEVQPDEYSRFIMLIYDIDLDLESLQGKIISLVPKEMGDSVKVNFHLPARILPHQALLPSHVRNNGLEIMTTEDVELIMRF